MKMNRARHAPSRDVTDPAYNRDVLYLKADKATRDAREKAAARPAAFLD